MKNRIKIISAFLVISILCTVLCSCSGKATPVQKENFRVTAYLVGDRVADNPDFDTSGFKVVTDIILFGVTTFDEEGSITVSDNFKTILDNVKSKMLPNQRIHINLLGPSYKTDSTDWNEQMNDLAERNTKAFESGNLENNIKEFLLKYDFDGVFFDYEYPLKSKYWKPFDSFILRLDDSLGDDFIIGMALSDWCAKQSKAAREATDMVELMSYDLWDKQGNHSTVELAEKSIKKMLKLGYKPEQLDLGVPFYARPTTKEAYWYDYASYADKLDDNGLYQDNETGLTFSFNTPEVMREKTQLAVEYGLGGMMVWHYSCDLKTDNEKSLFKAIKDGVNSAYDK